MKVKKRRQLEFIVADEIFDSAADMAEDLGVPNLTGLNVPIRTKLYDLVLAIYDEKIKDRKAFVSREVA